MESIFAITTTADTIPLDANGQGEVAFTITNNSDRYLQGQVKIRPQTPTEQSWLTLAQDTFLDFPKNATHNTTVQIKVPPGTAAGKYPFRIDVVSTAKPDEDFTEGPIVAFEVRASKQPAKPFPWWILALAAVVLAVGGVFTWLIFFRSVAVPDVTGKRVELAIEKLDEQGFKYTQSRTESSNPAQVGTVTKQEPPANTQVARGSEVALTVAIAPEQVQIPNEVAGSKLPDATQLLVKAGFTLGTVTGDYNKTVVRTDPRIGNLAPKGATVNIVMESSGGTVRPSNICKRIDCSLLVRPDVIRIIPSP